MTLVKDNIMKVGLVLIGMLAVVNRSKLEDAVAVVGAGAGAGGLSRGSSRRRGTSVRADSGLLRVLGSSGWGEGEERRLGSRGEREELLRRKSRHCECCREELNCRVLLLLLLIVRYRCS